LLRGTAAEKLLGASFVKEPLQGINGQRGENNKREKRECRPPEATTLIKNRSSLPGVYTPKEEKLNNRKRRPFNFIGPESLSSLKTAPFLRGGGSADPRTTQFSSQRERGQTRGLMEERQT